MNAQRYRDLEQGQSAIARKVLSVVPLQDPWCRNEICFELRRLGSQPDTAVVDGCLRSLLDAGLIREVHKGRFLRIQPKEAPAKAAEPAVEEDPATGPFTLVTDEPKKPPFDRLVSLAAQMRGVADDLTHMADLADELALRFEEQRAAAAAGGEKLRQLQALLKDLG